MTFKQQYLHTNGPFPFDFHNQRTQVFQTILTLLKQFHPNQWSIRSFDLSSILQSFKQIYGITATQLAQIINILLAFVTLSTLSCQGYISVMNILVTLKQYKINLDNLIKIDTQHFFTKLKHLNKQGIPYPLKNCDMFIQNYLKIIKLYCRYGQQYTKQITQLAITKKNIKYIAIFVKAVTQLENAQNILDYLFEQSNIFQRDVSFFYIIAELMETFYHINIQPYFNTLSQQIIKVITTVIDPPSQQDLKAINTQQSSIQVPCILKSVAKILVNCLRRTTQPGWQRMWSNIQRIFSIIAGLIDHTHQIQCMNDFLIFMKQFVKCFIAKYHTQQGKFAQINEDYIQQYSSKPKQIQVINQTYINLFHQIWLPLIPQLLYLQDTQVRAAKILTDLAIFDPKTYLALILQQIKLYLQKDLTIYQSFTPKMTILFLQQYIINNYAQQHQFSLLVQCCESLMNALQKIGMAQNLDFMQLAIRLYMYIPQKYLDQKPILQSLTQDIIQIILQNMEPMSINLEESQGEEAELYTDFKNIYFNFIIRLNDEQIKGFCDKMLYKIVSTVPSHRKAYEFVIVALCYVQPQFSTKILDALYKNIVTVPTRTKQPNHLLPPKSQNPKSKPISQQLFPYYLDYTLATKNQQHLRWYSSLIFSAFQYHPQNVISNWNKLQIIIILMIRQFDNANIFDWGVDILFNIIVNLEQIHLDYKQYFKNCNRKYQTMGNVQWIYPNQKNVELLLHIKNRFYQQLITYMYGRYSGVTVNEQNVINQNNVNNNFDKSNPSGIPLPHPINPRTNQIVDSLLIPNTPSNQAIQQKKYIHKILSIQYTVFSALQIRAQLFSKQDLVQNGQISQVFLKQLGNIRKPARQYLKWMLKLLGNYSCLYDQCLLNLFHFYWRQAHDQLYFSIGIESTNQKLIPYLYPIQYKKKQLFQNSFLILTQCYLAYMMRIQLYSLMKPTAYINDPQFLQYQTPLVFSNVLDYKFKSYIPTNINPHFHYHYQIFNICRNKLSLTNPNSYIRKYIYYLNNSQNQSSNKSEKQKYLKAIRILVNNFKRVMSIFIFACCMRDQNSWYGLQQMLQVSQHLQKKTDKVGIVQTIYLIVVFSFDFRANHIYSVNIKKVQRGQLQLTTQDTIMLNKIVQFIKYLMLKINQEITKKFLEKDATVLLLFLLCYSEFVPLSHPIYQSIIPLVFQITIKDNQDIMNMGKSIIFRLLNRYILKKQRIQLQQNIPIKRKFDQFLMFRYLGGRTIKETGQPVPNLMTLKTQNFYYPVQQLEYLYRTTLDPNQPNQSLLLSKITDEQTLTSLFLSLSTDVQLKSQQSEVDVSYLNQQQPKKIHTNGHKLINYILDNNPKNMDIYQTFIENFSNYPICYYHRFFRKMMVMGGKPTITLLQKIARKYIQSLQKQQVKLSQFLMVQILPFCFDDEQFYNFYTNFLVKCSKQQFEFANACLLVVFCIDWRVSKTIFTRIIQKLRDEKGSSRLRHLQVFNNYILCNARFGQQQAKNGIDYLMKGIQQGTDQISQLIVSMLIYCFIVPINLKQLPSWLLQQQLSLLLTSPTKIYKLNKNTGYNIDPSVRLIIKQIIYKSTQQKHMESKNLKVYSKIAYKILRSITVYRFNDQFYSLFKQFMQYIVNKPLLEQGGYDQEIVNQLKNSQYPDNIYQDLLIWLNSMEDNTINVIKKKLKYIENVVINKSFCRNCVTIPNIFLAILDKNVTIDHIVAVSNMARIMTSEELTRQVQLILSTQNKTTKTLSFMMAYLLAAGTRDFEWRQRLLNQILSFKKYKIVKEFVSYWWKGRNPQTQKQQRLCMLVRSVENPYSYFA